VEWKIRVKDKWKGKWLEETVTGSTLTVFHYSKHPRFCKTLNPADVQTQEKRKQKSRLGTEARIIPDRYENKRTKHMHVKTM